MLQGAIIGAVVGLIYALVAYFKAKSAKGLEYLKAMPKRVMSFEAPLPPENVMAALAGGLPGANAKLEASDPATHRVLLAQPATFNNWGFFIPVSATASGAGSKVDVGIASRSFLWGPAVTKAHEAVVKEVKKALNVPA